MARIELPEETRKRVEAIGTTEFVLGIAGPVHPQDLRAKAIEWISSLATTPLKTVIVYMGVDERAQTRPPAGVIEFVPYPPSQGDPSTGPWMEIANAQRSALALASLLQAKVCAVVHSDLAALLDPASRFLVAPVFDGKFDLVSPIYPESKYEGLINKGLLAPLSRALFGRRVRFPLPFDFCASARLLPKLVDPNPPRSQPGAQLLWPSNIVAMEGGQIGQAHIRASHTTQSDGLELSAVLGQLVGSLFQEIEACAAQWQRVRGSQPAEIFGAPPPEGETTETPADVKPLDTHPLFDSFLLGSRNLEEVWRLVLPPVSLFELKRLTRLTPEQFRMPDELWARIVYDFALAYRLRRIGRTHLLGALTPLYLGWVASYAQDVGSTSAAEADQRLDRLARIFESNKPYFLSRWRWPDRTN
ncbi:hypothetical protein HNQ77_002794 [Silvibacterium bohemicum]|uniref:Uncharacterized protein n=1 Tax=Silvibacterium bohemicum TaxID=1577686 RepID=A0A841K2G9_9BACT|nr:hypothetical protein [Silvibacterium bohemicum]MBB6144838.1 hypothetical protein [Silvibacterium bohemicum]